MDVDYPAAHSMDTHWFAIDKDGQVGLFFTAETGYLPSRAAEAEMPDLIELAIGDPDVRPDPFTPCGSQRLVGRAVSHRQSLLFNMEEEKGSCLWKKRCVPFSSLHT